MPTLDAEKRAKERAKEKRQRQRQKERDPEAYAKKMRERRKRYKERYPEKVKEWDSKPLTQEQIDRRNEKRREHRKNNPELYRAREKARSVSNPERNATKHRNRRARKESVGGRLSTTLKQSLMEKQKEKCAVCKKSVKKACHLDHIVPLALGGGNVDSNIQLLCPSCNSSKSAKHPVDFMQSRGFLL